MITAEPCLGRNCKVKETCDLYDASADTTHGFYTMDEGFVCEEYRRKDDPIVEQDDDQEALF